MVAATLAVAEVGMRMFESRLSVDVAHLLEISDIVNRLYEADGTRILFVGNSMIRRGIDPVLVEKELEARALPVSVASVFPDASSIVHWQYLLDRHVWRSGLSPELVVVGFARDQLADRALDRPERLGRWYANLSDVVDIAEREGLGFDESARLFLAGASAAYGSRHRVEQRVLDAVIPFYRRSRAVAVTSRDGRVVRRYSRLDSVVAGNREHGVTTVLVALPLRDRYDIDAGLYALARDAKTPLIDARLLPGLRREQFLDDRHLRPEGAALVSRRVAEDLAGILQRRP